MICNENFQLKKECPKVNCRKDCCNGCPFRKVVIPTVAGDDETGTIVPENGQFANALVEYEANGAMYIYSSDGIFTKVPVFNIDALKTGIPGFSDSETQTLKNINGILTWVTD